MIFRNYPCSRAFPTRVCCEAKILCLPSDIHCTLSTYRRKCAPKHGTIFYVSDIFSIDPALQFIFSFPFCSFFGRRIFFLWFPKDFELPIGIFIWSFEAKLIDNMFRYWEFIEIARFNFYRSRTVAFSH